MAESRLSEEQQKKFALDQFLEAWDKACENGVEADLLCEVMIYLAITDLVADRGEELTASLFEDLPARIKDGEFSLENADE
ncbi:hypothetical protein OAN80_01230 [Alphaproteobacteria bacterium]|jgi:hypothetical protein|nr:hypothetical protein [Alphaproteobacteria bacterium]|tara:strand:+ start:172 stop:414 length:243 start_codon:yes stop_codon:yes gene_type:complete